MKTPSSILTARQESVSKQRELVQQLESNKIAAQVQVAKLENTISKESAKLDEMKDSISFMTGLLSSLNVTYDADIEDAKQEGFEDGYKAHQREIKNPKKPLPKRESARKRRIK